MEFKIFNLCIIYNESSEAIYSIDEANNNILIGSSKTDYKFALVFQKELVKMEIYYGKRKIVLLCQIIIIK